MVIMIEALGEAKSLCPFSSVSDSTEHPRAIAMRFLLKTRARRVDVDVPTILNQRLTCSSTNGAIQRDRYNQKSALVFGIEDARGPISDPQ
jgi:hypothetical protein